MWIFYQLEDGLFKTIRCHEYDRTYFGPGEIPDTQGRPAGKTMWAEKFWIHCFWRSHSALMYLNMRGRWSTIKIQDEYFVNTCRMCWDRRLDNPNPVLVARWGWLSGQISHQNLISPSKNGGWAAISCKYHDEMGNLHFQCDGQTMAVVPGWG